MSAETLPLGIEAPIAPTPGRDVRKWTERDMLDLIHTRHAAKGGNGPRYVVAEHVRNEGGFGGYDREHMLRTGKRTTLRTADALVIDLWPSSGHLIHGFEVKVSRGDWLTELRDPTKAEAFKAYCHRWWLVAPDGVVHDDLPDGWGLLSPDRNGALRVKRRAPQLAPEPVPLGLMASWLRSATKTAVNQSFRPERGAE